MRIGDVIETVVVEPVADRRDEVRRAEPGAGVGESTWAALWTAAEAAPSVSGESASAEGLERFDLEAE